ncbi:response regulator [Alkalilimnicola ehrlichii]|uniref:response regulator n=1 Tax=Alkalilimnicola ehrlichii TaxID=351052 RepID=UPI00216179BB|nr:response regulator [Alkalilimnicola ehrlichii]
MPEHLVLRIPQVYSAYRLFVDAELVAAVGTVAAAPDEAQPDYGERRVLLTNPGPEIELMFHVSNYSARAAGFPRAIELGTPDAIAHRHALGLISNGALAGGLILIGISQLALFLLRRDETAYLFFGLATAAWGLQTIISGQLLSYAGWHLPIHIARPLDGFSALAAASMSLLFLSALFPRDLPFRYVRWVMLCLVIYVGVALLGSEMARSVIVGWLLYVVVGLMSLALIAVFRAWRRGEPDAGLFLLAGGIIALTACLQIYWFNAAGTREAVASLGALLAVGLQSMVLARRYARAFAHSRQLEKSLRRANQLKDEFLVNTSHELRTPLHAMIGLAEALPHRNDRKLAEGLNWIATSGHRLTRLVDDILDFTRLKYDDLAIERRQTRIEPLVHGVLGVCQPLLGTRPVALKADIEANLPAVQADPDRLHQVLFNLIGNAIKFTDRGQITVCVARAGDVVAVEVADTGLGIAQEDWPRLQQPYEQGRAAEGRGGLGLGLAITRRILELHGADMQVHSVPDQGTRIRFELPVAEGPGETTASASAAIAATRTADYPPPQEEPPSAKGPRILIVDDDDAAAAALEQQLALVGYQVRRAASGQQALALVSQAKPDLVMLDVMMPDMSGLAVCRHLREEYDANTLPIILVTARTRPEDIVEGLNAGANDHLAKPYYRVEMLARVDAHLRVQENEQMRWALSERHNDERDPREILTELLKKTVHYWEFATGRTRADLAEQSGLWTVTLDGSTRKTRTLDRYLSIDSLPKRPRWGIVSRTARYVIDHLDDAQHIEELEQLLAQLHMAVEH